MKCIRRQQSDWREAGGGAVTAVPVQGTVA